MIYLVQYISEYYCVDVNDLARVQGNCSICSTDTGALFHLTLIGVLKHTLTSLEAPVLLGTDIVHHAARATDSLSHLAWNRTDNRYRYIA